MVEKLHIQGIIVQEIFCNKFVPYFLTLDSRMSI